MTCTFVFPGQGAQAVGMCAAMIAASPLLRRRLQQGSDALGLELRTLILEGPPRALAQTHAAQVALYCLGHGLHEMLIERGFRADLMAGHSLGQFTAIAAAGAMDFEAGLTLVAARGRAMHELNQQVDGGMLAVLGCSVDQASEALQTVAGQAWVANLNAPDQWVVAGLRPALRSLQQRCQTEGWRCHWLDVSGPYHTPLMAPAAALFRPAIEACVLQDTRTPVLANTNGAAMRTRSALLVEMHAHMLSPVDWLTTMREIAARRPALLVEVGPGRVLKGLALRSTRQLPCMTTETPADFDAACAALEKLQACAS